MRRIRTRLPGFLANWQRRLTSIEQYVLTRTLRAVGGALAVISAVIMLIDFVEISRDIGGRVDVSAIGLIGLMLMKSPAVILQLLPFVFLFGVLAAFIGLNRRSELIAMRAAGVSAWRFIFPAAGAAFIIGILTITILNPFASWLDGQYQRSSDALLESREGLNTEPAAVWLRQGDGRTQVVITAEERDADSSLLRNVSMFVYATGDDGRRAFQRRIEAETARLVPGAWELTNAREAAAGEQAVTYATLSIRSNLTLDKAFEGYEPPRSTPFWRLPGLISTIESAGFSATQYRLRLHELLATPLMFAAMSVLAAAFSLRLMRLGDMPLMVVSAVGLGFVFYFVSALMRALGESEVLPPFAAAWIPPLLVVLSAFTLLCYTEDG
ncbi:MAG: LPS export ABC transporter permease LptG [Caulobacterales bacterium]|nr:LPS export ABC transporter permease LptG [Caulobacterales bacterium]